MDPDRRDGSRRHGRDVRPLDAGGFEESFADRLAFLVPSHGEGDADGDAADHPGHRLRPRLGRQHRELQAPSRHASRASRAWLSPPGPSGEFVFNVTHRPDVSFRDAVPTMPGFAARVTNTADGVVHVTARDPEAEG